jgi:hypothetical protein
VVTMWETMTAWNTGTNMTPSTAQVGATVGTTFERGLFGTPGLPQRWCLIATSKTFWLWIEGNSTAPAPGNSGSAYGFGDIDSFRPGDAYGTVLLGYQGNANAAVGLSVLAGNLTTNNTGQYLMRRWDQLSSGINCGKHTDVGKSNSTGVSGSNGLPYPNPADGGIYLAPMWMHENVVNGVGSVRGIVPGVWAILHAVGTPPSNLIN